MTLMQFPQELLYFDTSFTDIQAVRIELAGTVQAGSAYEYFNPEIYHDIYGSVESKMEPPDTTGYWWASTFPLVSPFDIEESFTWVWYPEYSEPSWDFLLDGQGEVAITFSCQIPISLVPVTLPTCNISEAYLIVESVPEPATLLLLCFGALMLRKKR